jgi:diguanylate cyclase (GGDEF)-like protein
LIVREEIYRLFRLNLYLPFIVVALFMLITTIVSAIYIQELSIHERKGLTPEKFHRLLNDERERLASELKEYQHFIKENRDVAYRFAARDKEALFALTQRTYERLNTNHDLTHMYFIEPDGKVLLRVHDYDRDGDTIDRYTFERAKATQSTYHGIEFGIKKNYTLRVVTPWVVNGELIGYLELGKEIDKIMLKLSSLLQSHIYMAAYRSLYSEAPDFVKARIADQHQNSEYVIVYHTYELPKAIDGILNGDILHTDITMHDHSYYVTKSPLNDASGKEIGYFIFLTDTTFEHAMMYTSAKYVFVIFSVITILIISIGSVMMRRREASINHLTEKLVEERDKLSRSKNRLQKLFDMQQHMIILTDTRRIHMANKALLDFFGYRHLDQFLIEWECICHTFVDNDSFFSLKNVTSEKNWVESIEALPLNERVVAIIDKQLDSHAFKVQVTPFEEDEYLVTFTDISDTVIETNELRHKMSHDPLTGAYNREFFNDNINYIIKNSAPQLLGIALCDIDHFKKVNDTHGHAYGDIVLKEVVRVIEHSIRKSDYLIRWGGEEFVLLLRVDTVDALTSAIENIRARIEALKCEKVDKVTCSFGATLYAAEFESISETIERADELLYISKTTGRNRVTVR